MALSLYPNIKVVPLYCSARRLVVVRNGMLIIKDDDRLQLKQVKSSKKNGYASVPFSVTPPPPAGGVESGAGTMGDIIQERFDQNLRTFKPCYRP
jgi:sulfate adenylyltransferase subunit 2